MSANRTVLLVGGTDTHLERAKALGLTVVLVQHRDKITAFQTGLADALLMVDYTDWDAVAPLADAAHAVWGFAAVLSLTEGGLETAARLNDRFGFPGNGHEVVRRMRDKGLMRRHLAAHGRLSTDFAAVTDRESLLAFGARAGYPFIVKPTGATASFGLLRVADAADTDRVWERIEEMRGRRTDRGSTLFTVHEFLMEAYLDGPEFSVESFSFAGRHVVVAVTEKLVDEAHFAELGHALPARLDEAAHAAVVAAVTEFLDVMGVTDGPTHTELRLGRRGPAVIESHTRNGGDRITDLVAAAYGIDLVRYGLGWPLRLVEELPDRPAAAGAACIRFLRPEPGTVTAVSGPAELAQLPEVLAVQVTVAPGDTVRPLHDNWDRVGHLAVRAADTDAAVALCERLAGERIRIEVASEALVGASA
ncbi:ATP-grasp domain-containing protein [Kitasatospora sp. NPDC059571]|uniref:ATP-grasp domain-containing protein n=1 Tax=Kitasatospora sp. NPDC059571 TaxID=3346871 RepID=UPI0036952D9F